MTESSDDIIILSDDEDDIKIESVKSVKSVKRPKPIHNPRPTRVNTSSTSSLKHRTAILVLTEPKSLSYGIERGYKLKRIHGVKRLKPENQLMYLVEYESCDDYEFVPSNILREYCNENLLIEYLEKLTEFTD